MTLAGEPLLLRAPEPRDILLSKPAEARLSCKILPSFRRRQLAATPHRRFPWVPSNLPKLSSTGGRRHIGTPKSSIFRGFRLGHQSHHPGIETRALSSFCSPKFQGRLKAQIGGLERVSARANGTEGGSPGQAREPLQERTRPGSAPAVHSPAGMGAEAGQGVREGAGPGSDGRKQGGRNRRRAPVPDIRAAPGARVPVSALLFPGGTPGRAFKAAIRGQHELAVSRFILQELARVLKEEVRLRRQGEGRSS